MIITAFLFTERETSWPQSHRIQAEGHPVGPEDEVVEGSYLTLLGHRLLVWLYFCSSWQQGVQADVILVADHFVAVMLLGELAKGALDDTILQMKHQVQGGLSEYCSLRDVAIL